MSLTFIIPARSGKRLTLNCLKSLELTCRDVGGDFRFVLIDDHSDPEHEIGAVFESFAAVAPGEVVMHRTSKREHYTGVFAAGIDRAPTGDVFFLSNDMIITPSFLRRVLSAAAEHPTAGIVRGTSAYCDSHPEYELDCPLKLRNYTDIVRFSEWVGMYYGGEVSEDKYLSGDAIWIRRTTIDAVGNLDTQFYGYFGDPDYGIRVRRAGFKLICARGAWLCHEGGGHIRVEREKLNGQPDTLHEARMALVHAAYEKFRAKWDLSMPERYDMHKHMRDVADWDKLSDPKYVPATLSNQKMVLDKSK